MKVFGLKIKSGDNKSLKDNLLRFDCKHSQDLNDWEVADYLKDHIHFWFTFDSSHIWLVESKEDAFDALLKFPEYPEDADGNFERPCFHNLLEDMNMELLVLKKLIMKKLKLLN